ncbi:DsbA family protein (plasmid) [Klebsiella sp. WOUb02]|uniref:DsbA family protein n=1 Tax=Klebsiella sp. WOUb02 TaxID=3161071 RepID=UPI003CEA6723
MMKLKNVLCFAAVTALAPAIAAPATPSVPFTAAQEQRIGEVAAEYLRTHPDILIEMSETLRAREEEKQTAALKTAALAQQKRITDNPGIPVTGPQTATVMAVVFFDYQCIWCSRLAPELEKVMQANTDVRYHFMEWPVFGSRWPVSLLAAKTGLLVWKEKGPEAYLAYHNGIYATGLIEGRLTNETVTKTSGDIQFRQNTIDEINTTLKNINDIATVTGFTGTPGIIVMPVKGATEENITVFSGMAESENIQAAINKARH